ncbi:MAG TPA: alpha/beta fold hydrolase [Micromonosporaceae bacterium]|nr:alpha/beta fold hydrolase [Micromonosporaceae bacterium]
MRQFVRPRPVDDPALRFIGFHHAGGSAAVLHPLARRLPPDWDALLLDLPGRGKRRSEPLIRDMDQLVDRVVRDVAGCTDAPYVLFGHSMGAILAIEVGRRLTAAGEPPGWVGVSGRSAPLTPVAGSRRLSEHSDAELFDTLLALGGMPERINDVPELKEYFLRVVRADFQAVDSYRPAADRLPLRCPLTAFGGISDAWAPPASLPAWEYETLAPFRQCFLPGGHFYFVESDVAALAREVRTEVRTAFALVGTDAGTLMMAGPFGPSSG